MSALVLLAQGAEEMEAVIAIDVLRRGGVSLCFLNLKILIILPEWYFKRSFFNRASKYLLVDVYFYWLQ